MNLTAQIATLQPGLQFAARFRVPFAEVRWSKILDGVPSVAGDEHDFMQKFAPATKDGEPVRYRKLVDIVLRGAQPPSGRFATRDQSRPGSVSSSGSRESGAAGFRLAIVQAIARQHGGDVSMISESGRGCRLRVVRPVADPKPCSRPLGRSHNVIGLLSRRSDAAFDGAVTCRRAVKTLVDPLRDG
jgi:hypothetical protein